MTRDLLLRPALLAGTRGATIRVACVALPATGDRRGPVRSALREQLAELLSCSPADVPLADRPGRPALAPGAGHDDVDLSVAASGRVGLVAVARGFRIGVDVEAVDGNGLADAAEEGWLSLRERARIAALDPSAQPSAVTRAWVQKEAVLKAAGVGLRGDLTRTETPPGAWGRVSGWLVTPVDVGSGYVGCLARRRLPLRARLRFEHAGGRRA